MRARSRAALYALLFLSGSAGLAYQTIWTKTFTVALGHEIPSLLAVVAAFFAGLSLGSWSLGRRIGACEEPAYWYAGFEVLIGLWALVSLFLLPVVNDVAVSLLGIDPHPAVQWFTAFMLPFVALLPATFAMGATLPAMEQVMARRAADGRVVGGAYATNTLGATLGVVASVFWLLPLLGQQRTLLVFAAVNIVCAVSMLLLRKGPSQPVRITPATWSKSINERSLTILLFVTGMLGIGYEVLAVRTMSQVFEGTLYSFATALAVYLAASSVGAAYFQRHAHRAATETWLPRLLLGLGYSCLLGLLVLYGAEDIYRALRLSAGDSMLAVLGSEMILALCVYLLPSFLMGVTFALLAQAARGKRGEIGRALGINTLGGSLAPLVFGVILLPLFGVKWALGIVALGYLALLPLAGFISASDGRPFGWFVRLSPAIALLIMPPLQILTLRDGERLVEFHEGVMASTAVVENGKPKNLRVNNRYQMGGTSAEALLFQRRQAHLPILLHPSPDRALFLGVASGATVGAAAVHADLNVDGVELVPEVLDLLEQFSPHNGSPDQRSNVQLHAADARRYVRAVPYRYDVVVADLFHPARDGAGLLFTREHYFAIAQTLNDGGLFCHWLPFHQLDMDMIRLITRTFLSVFPDGQLVLASDLLNYPALGLVTGIDNDIMKNGYLKNRVTQPEVRKALQFALIRNDLQLFSTVFLDSDALVELAGSGPLNTDDRPLVSYYGPRFTYARGTRPYGRLMKLLNEYETESVQMFSGQEANDPEFMQRFRQYVKARNLYLRGLRTQIEDGEEAALPVYLNAAQTSIDHETSFAQLYRLAASRAEHSPESALVIANHLLELRPNLQPIIELQRQLKGRVDSLSQSD